MKTGDDIDMVITAESRNVFNKQEDVYVFARIYELKRLHYLQRLAKHSDSLSVDYSYVLNYLKQSLRTRSASQ